MGFMRVHGTPPPRPSYAYVYSVRIVTPNDEYFTDGTLHAGKPLTDRRAREIVVGDLIAEVREQMGVALRAADVRVDHFTYTQVPVGGGR